MKPNMSALLKQAQKMQEQLSKAQDELDNLKAEGASGGGMIKVVANGKQEVESVKIDPEVIDAQDPEMLEAIQVIRLEVWNPLVSASGKDWVHVSAAVLNQNVGVVSLVAPADIITSICENWVADPT